MLRALLTSFIIAASTTAHAGTAGSIYLVGTIRELGRQEVRMTSKDGDWVMARAVVPRDVDLRNGEMVSIKLAVPDYMRALKVGQLELIGPRDIRSLK